MQLIDVESFTLIDTFTMDIIVGYIIDTRQFL